ncbi:protein Wnt-7b isoform X1 [Bombyx mandarina]|uniref:Protein Wnt n=1 Tax=Bombyx mandarina TaxID=7092 RepID=A0A6J2JG21_BOMMA|nr:protein Wnt-7b isoform X1 [Bombyx mandarina]XP_028027395.1 protein Wnt-7b isoform X1 [Bombyx mandarina]
MLECIRPVNIVVHAAAKFGKHRVRSTGQFLLIFLVLHFIRTSSSGGISLGAHLVCAKAPGLTDKQRAMCRSSPSAIAAIGDGLKMAYEECRAQLSGHRWNCSGVGDGNHFGHVMPLATREAAFTYAITSAGVTHALSMACARGELPGCGCTGNKRRTINTIEQFQWGGCGSSAYGARLARRFLDARELERDGRTLMNLHNNRVGRKVSEVVKDLVHRECKCHGVSGSCAMRTCWRALPQFRTAAATLRDKYKRAKLVMPHPPTNPQDINVRTHLVIKRQKHPGLGRQPRKSELVFLEQSPSYCEPDTAAGSFGTHGRICNRTSRGEDGCETLCCGRGYSTTRSVEETKCRCQFHWCCNVTCSKCVTTVETHLCN